MLRRLRIENLVIIREATLELGPGLNVVTGETGAGKTILTQAIGLLLGAKGDHGFIGPASDEAYVEAEIDLPAGVLEEDGFETLAELRPSDEPGLVVARRVFPDGRSRSYAWGRAVAREDAAQVVERLLAMSGQFEQRRLARPGHQLDLLDAFVGEDQLRRRRESASIWRDLQGARRRRETLAGLAAGGEEHRAELEALVQAVERIEGGSEDALRTERDRLRNATALVEAASSAAESLAPELSDVGGAADLVAAAQRELAPLGELAPELAAAAGELTDAAGRLREIASGLRSFLHDLETEPGRLARVEEALEELADAKRRFRAESVSELVERAEAAREELAALEAGVDPLATSEAEVAALETSYTELAEGLHASRLAVAEAFGEAARAELAALGLGEGDLAVELSEREPGPAGVDEVSFSIRPNTGMPFAPIARAASGGELSRIALALRTIAHSQAGEPTIVFDEIDAGIGGTTAHEVAEALRRLAEGCQVITITHLPQIASIAERHFRVEKIPGDPTHTRIELLSEEERRLEVARMLGGAEFLEAFVSAPSGSASESSEAPARP